MYGHEGRSGIAEFLMVEGGEGVLWDRDGGKENGGKGGKRDLELMINRKI